MKKPVTNVILDADDTLWKTRVLYESAISEVWRMIVDTIPTIDGKIEQFQERMNAAERRNEWMELSMHRFPQTLGDVFLQYCIEDNCYPHPEHVNVARWFGYKVYEKKAELFSDVIPTLEKVTSGEREYRLLLLTSGDKHVQWKRIKDYWDELFSLYFTGYNDIFVVDHKDENVMKFIIDHNSLRVHQTWMIGNSPRNDIRPAVMNGIRSICVNGASWSREEWSLKEKNDSYRHLMFSARGFKQAFEIIESFE